MPHPVNGKFAAFVRFWSGQGHGDMTIGPALWLVPPEARSLSREQIWELVTPGTKDLGSKG